MKMNPCIYTFIILLLFFLLGSVSPSPSSPIASSETLPSPIARLTLSSPLKMIRKLISIDYLQLDLPISHYLLFALLVGSFVFGICDRIRDTPTWSAATHGWSGRPTEQRESNNTQIYFLLDHPSNWIRWIMSRTKRSIQRNMLSSFWAA